MKRTILLLVTLLSSLTIWSQNPIKFPPEVEDSYFHEDYFRCDSLSLVFLRGFGSDMLKAAPYYPRAGFYSAWNKNLVQARGFDGLWNQYKPELQGVNPNQIADWLTIKAVLAESEERFPDAIDTLSLALNTRILTAPHEIAIQADSYQFLGRLLKVQKEFTESILSYRESENLNTGIDREGAIMGVYVEKAEAALALNPNDPNILNQLFEALEYFNRTKNPKMVALTLNELGNYYNIQEDYRAAATYLRESMEIKEKYKLNAKIDIAYNNLSIVYNYLEQRDSSLYYMVKALETIDSEELVLRAKYLSNLGALYGYQNQPELALQKFKEALAIMCPGEEVDQLNYNPDPDNFDPILPEIIANKGNALLELASNENYKTDYLELAIEAFEVAIKQFNLQRNLLSFETKSISFSNNRDYFFLALKASAKKYLREGKPEDLQSVVNLAQQSKAVVFNEYQRILQVRDSLSMDPKLILIDDSLKSHKAELIQSYNEAARSDTSNPEFLARLNSEIIATNQRINTSTAYLKSQYPQFYQYIETPPNVRLQDIQSLIGKDELLIDYTYTKKGLIILTFSHEETKVFISEAPNSFADQVQRYQNHLRMQTGVGFAEFIKLGNSFWELLVKPIENEIADKKLLIIPDGIIGYLPFDTFVTDTLIPQRKHYNELPMLIKDFTISYLNSINQFERSRNRSQKSDPAAITAFAPFCYEAYQSTDLGLGILKGSEKEVNAISHLVPVKKYFGKEANLKAFDKTINNNGIIHLATHGVLSAGNPMKNRILFYPDGSDSELQLFEVLNLKIKARLVVLSACETGAGDLQEGEGIMSLTRGFHYAGTPSLVMSLWPAFDSPSISIMSQFYYYLSRSEKMADAIRFAKLDYLNHARSAESHPAFWANYQLSGANDPLPLKKKIHWLIWVAMGILAGALLTGLIGWGKSRKNRNIAA